MTPQPAAASVATRETQPSEPSGALRDVAIRSGAYLAGREAAGMVVRLVGLVVVVREIGPAAYGLYSAAAVFVAFAAALAQMGAEVLLAKAPGPLSRRRYDEVFTVLVATSLAVVVAGLGLSYALAPWLRPVGVLAPLRVLLLSVPVNVLWAPAQACLERKFAFRRMGLLELGGDVVLYGVAVPLAVTGAGPWSLVVGYVAWQSWLFVGSLTLSGLRPRLRWSTSTAREVFAHGRTVALSRWIAGARSSIITLVVGAFAGAAGVGYVNFAGRLVGTINFTGRGAHRIGIVAVARRQEQPGKLAAALEEGMLLLALVTAVPFAAFGVVAHWAVPAVFGPAWTPALAIYGLLALGAVLRVPATVQGTLLYGFGRNRPVAVAAAIDLALTCGISVVAVRSLGIAGYGIGGLVAVVSIAWTHHAAGRLVPVRYGRVVVPVLAMAPAVLAPVLPVPWALLSVVPLLVLPLHPPTRGEIVRLVATVRGAMARRRSVGPVAAPSRGGAELEAEGANAEGANAAITANGHSPGGVRPSWSLPSGGPGRSLSSGGLGWDGTDLLEGPDPVTGLPPAGVLLARLGRLLGAGRGQGWSVVVAAVDVGDPLDEGALVAVSTAMRRELRFDDPLARLGPSVFVAAAPVVEGGATGGEVAGRLGLAAGSECPAAKVAHVVTPLPSTEEADRLVREVVRRVHS